MNRTTKVMLAAAALSALTACSKAALPPAPPTEHSIKSKAVMAAGPEQVSQTEVLPLSQQVTSFIRAFEGGDYTAIETLVSAQPGTYQSWAEVQPKDVTITALEENAFFGKYIVTFEVSRPGQSGFRLGENKRILVAGEQDGVTSLVGFYAEEALPLSCYEREGLGREMELPERQVRSLIRYGVTSFTNASTLPADQLVAFAAAKIGEKSFQEGGGYDSGSITEDELKLFIWKHFGLSDFDVTQSSYYNSETKRFTILPAKVATYSRVVDGYENASGSYTVRVQLYHDPLYAIPMAKASYLLSKNEDDTYKFVSCVMDKTMDS